MARRWITRAVLSLTILGTSLALTYLRTFGEISLMGLHRTPTPFNIMACLAGCEQTSNCICVRLDTKRNNSCELLPANKDSNTLNSEGFVYYAQDKYRDTVGKNNIALHKPAQQSSIYRMNGVSYGPERAVDGSSNTDGFKKPYISHTMDGEKAESYPWWQVDLGHDHVVTAVQVLNREKWAGRLHDFEVRVSGQKLSSEYNDHPFEGGVLCSKHDGAGIPDRARHVLLCHPCPAMGRYVSIQIVKFCDNCTEPTSNVLQLAEVEVYAYTILKGSSAQ